MIARTLLPALFLLAAAPAGADEILDFSGTTPCPAIYQPVCAKKGGETRTLPNRCVALRAGFSIVGGDACGGTTSSLRANLGDPAHIGGGMSAPATPGIARDRSDAWPLPPEGLN